MIVNFYPKGKQSLTRLLSFFQSYTVVAITSGIGGAAIAIAGDLLINLVKKRSHGQQ
jgi:hypothetical protein